MLEISLSRFEFFVDFGFFEKEEIHASKIPAFRLIRFG